MMANYLSVMFSQSTNNWLMGLREDSIELGMISRKSSSRIAWQHASSLAGNMIYRNSIRPLGNLYEATLGASPKQGTPSPTLWTTRPSPLSPEESITIRSYAPNFTARGPRPSANSSRLQTHMQILKKLIDSSRTTLLTLPARIDIVMMIARRMGL